MPTLSHSFLYGSKDNDARGTEAERRLAGAEAERSYGEMQYT